MTALRRIVLVRHGETDGESSVRFHGANDVALADSGRAHMREVARALARERFDVVASSPLRRAWQSAWIVGGGAPVRFEPGFREVDFGRWEGLTRDEIARTDPVLYEDWQRGSEDFVFPGGEARADFRTRVLAGLDRLLAADARSALVVVHKGSIRLIARELTGEEPAPGQLELGGVVELTRDGDAGWFLGRRSSDPPALSA